MVKDIWLSLFFLGLLLFSWPFMEIFLNTLPFYLFSAWLVFIILMYVASKRSGSEDGGN